MAEQEQVERLKRSIKEWNAWRQQHPKIHPDLSSVDLSGTSLNTAVFYDTNLSNANLRNADLSHASFSNANLSHANLSHANLSHANFSHANLSHAKLYNTYFYDTYLSSTCLFRSDLGSAILLRSKLHEADFREACFYHTTLAWVDLSSVKGLETTIHDGPSAVDINSVTFPHDEYTRKHFLSGVGFTETQIEYLPSLLTPRPIEYHSLFISYAHQDQVIAKRLYDDLRKSEVPCWFAPHDLRPGKPILRSIEEAIHLHDKLLLILSHHAVISNWVQQEVETALYKQVTSGQEILFPVRLDNTVLESDTPWAKRLRHRHIGDFTHWENDVAYQQAFTTLLRHLKVDKSSTLL